MFEIPYTSVCLLLIGAVLLQGGENVDITAAFGGTSQAAFGPRGSVTLLAKITWVLGAIFIVTSITLAVHASRDGRRLGVGKRAGQNRAGGSCAGEEVGRTVVSCQFSVVSKTCFDAFGYATEN